MTRKLPKKGKGVKAVRAWAVLNMRGNIDAFSVCPQKGQAVRLFSGRAGCKVVRVIITVSK